MNIEYVGRNFALDEPTRTYAEHKLAKLDRFLEDPTEVRLTLSLDGHRHVAELHVVHRHGTLQAGEASADMRESILAVIDKAERQARKGRQRAQDRWRRAGRAPTREARWSGEPERPDTAPADEDDGEPSP